MAQRPITLTVIADMLAGLGRSTLFLLRILAGLPSLVLRPSLVVQQLYAVGVLSLIIIIVSGTFVGMVLGLQGYNTLRNFGAAESSASSWPCRCCGNWARWSPGCCSPAVPVRPWRPRSA